MVHQLRMGRGLYRDHDENAPKLIDIHDRSLGILDPQDWDAQKRDQNA